MSAKLIRFLSFLAAILISLGWMASPQEKPSPATKVGSISNPVTIYDDTFTPITATLQMDPLPLIGKPATLTCTVSSYLDAPGTRVQIELPPDAKLLEGMTDWSGDLYTNVPFNLSIQVEFASEGKQAIFCRALHNVNESEIWGDLAQLYLTVGSKSSHLGYPPETPEVAKMLTPGEGRVLENIPIVFPKVDTATTIPVYDIEHEREPPIPPANVKAAGNLTITGGFKYYDRADNFIGASVMLVEIVKGDDGTHLAYCYTDTSGAYTCGPFNNPGSAGVRAWVMTKASYAPNPDTMQVVNSNISDPNWYKPYTINSNVQVFTNGTHDIGWWYVGNGVDVERAFWIEKDLLDSWAYVYFKTGSSQVPQETGGGTTVMWTPDSTDGDYFARGTDQNIYLTGTAPISQTVVMHEFGHQIMYNIYKPFWPSESCPDPHYLYIASSHGCAWTEGWANFFSVAVNMDRGGDTFIYWDSGAKTDLEAPTWNYTYTVIYPPPTPPYTAPFSDDDITEGRVAGSLWDMVDTSNDGSDEINSYFPDIWDTIYHQDDNNFSEFWTAWKSRGHAELGPVMAIYQNTINYRSSPPGTFTKSSPANAATNQPASVTLSWAASTGATSYAYCYDTSNNSTCNGSWVSTGTNRTATISSLSPSTTYYWQVRAQKSTSHTYANGPGATWRSFTTGTVPAAFNKSAPASGATNQLTSLTLSWAAATNATSYSYCYDTTNDGSCAVWTNTGTNRNANLSGLNLGTTYYWQARAINGFGSTFANGGSGAYWSFTTDGTAPVVGSIVTANPSPTNATSVGFTVTFSESVTGVAVDDFSLTTSGISGTSVTSVSGSGATRTVSVNTGSGNGTLRLDVPASATITDLAGNPLASLPYTGGQTYTIDKTAPTVTMTSPASNPTNASPIAVSVTFSESVNGFASTDIVPANGAVSNFAGSGASYSFDLTPAGQGSVTADIAAGVATDSAGNANTIATQFSRTYDTTAPTVLSSLHANPSPTNLASVNFTVTFSESVTGVAVDDFSLTTSGISGTSVTGVSGSGATRTVSVNTGSGNGTLRLNVPASATVTDLAGNPLASLPYTGGQTYTIDKTAPTLAMTSPASNPTNASPIAVSVTFSESVNGFASTDIVPANGAVSNFAGSGASYTFDLTPVGQGSVTANIAAGVATDSAGNANTIATQFSRTYDTAAPTVLSSLRTNPNPTSATSVGFTVTFSESVTGVAVGDFSLTTSGLSGAAVSGVSGSGSVYTVTVNTGSGNGTLRLDIPVSATVTDLAGNPLASLPYTGGETYTVNEVHNLFLPLILR